MRRPRSYAPPMRLEPADEYAPKGDDVLEALARVPDRDFLHAGVGLEWPRCRRLKWPHLRPNLGRTFGALLSTEAKRPEGVVREWSSSRRSGAITRGRGCRSGTGEGAWGASPRGRQALESAVPPAKRAPAVRPAPKLGAYRAVIDAWIAGRSRGAAQAASHGAADLAALVAEHGAEVSERQVCRYVRRRRGELGDVGEVFVPLVSDAGVEAEVDWGEAKVRLAGELVDVHLFVMRACFSGAGFVIAFRNESQQAFLEAHVAAFEWFGGVFDLVRYDNLKAAVAQVLKGRRRVESDRFVAMRSHYRFESSFCLSGQQGAHEKGGVEGEVGRFRRRHLVPVPEVESIEQLNELLEEACWQDLQRTITGHPATVGERLELERRLAEHVAARASRHQRGGVAAGSTARRWRRCARTATRSRPRWPGCASRPGSARATSAFWHDGRQVARHERLAGKHRHQRAARSLPRSAGAQARQRWRGRWRCARNATAETGPPASTSCGRRSASAQVARRPGGRWSTF